MEIKKVKPMYVGADEVSAALRRLIDEGKIEHVGSNRFGHYVIK